MEEMGEWLSNYIVLTPVRTVIPIVLNHTNVSHTQKIKKINKDTGGITPKVLYRQRELDLKVFQIVILNISTLKDG